MSRISLRPRRPWRISALARAYWVNPRKAPDFAWAWLSRFLVMCGNYTLLSYQAYFLMSRFGYTKATIGPVVFKVLLINTVAVVGASIAFGAVSDRLRRRKHPFEDPPPRRIGQGGQCDFVSHRLR